MEEDLKESESKQIVFEYILTPEQEAKELQDEAEHLAYIKAMKPLYPFSEYTIKAIDKLKNFFKK